MEIDDALPKKTEELSKGMQQKIQFIGCVLHDPGLIVMDEPFSGLDPVNATLLERTLLELKDQGKAILFSTHRMDQVEKLCDTICLVNYGRAVLAGKMRDIKSSYERNRVIVEFEGDASFLNSSEVESSNNYSGHAEIRLHPHGDAQKLLHEAAAVATIYRFELVEPSLEEIFIQDRGRQGRCVTSLWLPGGNTWSRSAAAPSAFPPFLSRCCLPWSSGWPISPAAAPEWANTSSSPRPPRSLAEAIRARIANDKDAKTTWTWSRLPHPRTGPAWWTKCKSKAVDGLLWIETVGQRERLPQPIRRIPPATSS